jgi:hypothetical protein
MLRENSNIAREAGPEDSSVRWNRFLAEGIAIAAMVILSGMACFSIKFALWLGQLGAAR